MASRRIKNMSRHLFVVRCTNLLVYKNTVLLVRKHWAATLYHRGMACERIGSHCV